MAARKKGKTIAIDLDGVIIDKPPFVPKELIEWLYRSHETKKLSYRIPSDWEKKLRLLAHMHFLRPAIQVNVEFLKTLKKEGYEIYAVSSRYGFLEKKTHEWLKAHELKNVISEVHLNTKDEQPHLFKKRILSNMKLDVYIDDDKPLVRYLKTHCPTNQIALISHRTTIEKLLREKGIYS